MRRIVYSVGLLTGVLILGLWMTLTRRLSELGVDVGLGRLAMVVVSFSSLAFISLEEAAGSLRARRARILAIRSGQSTLEAGQISVATADGELSLAPTRR